MKGKKGKKRDKRKREARKQARKASKAQQPKQAMRSTPSDKRVTTTSGRTLCLTHGESGICGYCKACVECNGGLIPVRGGWPSCPICQGV